MKKLLYSECIFLMRAMGPRVLYPLHLCPILKNLSMQHISGYDLIQGAIGCSVASPLGATKSGMRLHAHVPCGWVRAASVMKFVEVPSCCTVLWIPSRAPSLSRVKNLARLDSSDPVICSRVPLTGRACCRLDLRSCV